MSNGAFVRPAAEAAHSVQVFIPVYNDIDYFPRALRSVLDQQDVDLEVIVSDNASTDGTYEYANRLAAEDNRVKLFRNSGNIGSIANINQIANYVTADYYVFLCSDDALGDRSALRKAKDVLDKHPDVVSVYCDLLYIDGRDRRLGARRFRPTGFFDSDKALRGSILSYRNCFGIPLLNRRSVCLDIPYPDNMTYVADLYVAARTAERGRVFHIGETLIWNRYTGKNLTARLIAQSARQFAGLIETLGLTIRLRDRFVRALRFALVVPGKYVFLKIAKIRS